MSQAICLIVTLYLTRSPSFGEGVHETEGNIYLPRMAARSPPIHHVARGVFYSLRLNSVLLPQEALLTCNSGICPLLNLPASPGLNCRTLDHIMPSTGAFPSQGSPLVPGAGPDLGRENELHRPFGKVNGGGGGGGRDKKQQQ